MQGAGLIVGPLLAIALLSTGMSQDLVWRLLLAFGAIPALSVFYLRRQLNETPRFQLAQMEAEEADKKAKQEGKATGLRGVLADRRLLRWLIGASLAWFLFDLVYYGNTISSPIIVKLVAPDSRETLEQLDGAPTSREQWKIMFISGMGFFTDTYDLFVIGIVATLVTTQWHIAGYQKSLLTSLALLTSAAGAIIFGRVADRLGRKKIYGYEVLVLAAGAIASALSPGIW